MGKRLVYMDHNATTPLHPQVRKVMEESMDLFGNASSFHSFGRAAEKYIEKARENIALFLGSSPEEIIFVASGSEGNNTILDSFYSRSQAAEKAGREVEGMIISSVEHPSILDKANYLKEKGLPVYVAPVDNEGKVDIERYRKLFENKIGLVSIIFANNEIGTISDIEELSEIAHCHGAYFHTDAVQAFGKIDINVDSLGIDSLTVAAHKIYGPKGIGALYARKGVPFYPLIIGGHQESGRRAGTENTHGVIGFGKAVEMARMEMSENNEKINILKSRLKEGIEDNIGDIKFNGHMTDSLPGTLNVSFDGTEGESMILYLDMQGIAVSTGAACSAGSLDPSHVLMAIGLMPNMAHGAVRFSLGRDNTVEDVDYVLEYLPGVVRKLKGIPGVYIESK